MSGILDNKKRVIDAILTLEGRRQAASGDLRVRYYSFSDAGTFYKADLQSGSSDATSRLHLEASHLPQDQITFEADDSGLLKPFANETENTIKNGQIINYSQGTSTENALVLKGAEFATTAEVLLNESITNFEKLVMISSKDEMFEDDSFGVGNNKIDFVIHDDRPLSDSQSWFSNINEVESIFNDPRFANVTNFAYLPPVNKITDESIDKKDHRATSKFHLGDYRPWGRTHLDPIGYEQLIRELSFYTDLGYSKTVHFDPTSKNNNLMLQFFEQGFSTMKKLDVIDYGKLRTGNQSSPLAHVFFVGKLAVDDNNTHTFIHLFTLVFE